MRMAAAPDSQRNVVFPHSREKGGEVNQPVYSLVHHDFLQHSQSLIMSTLYLYQPPGDTWSRGHLRRRRAPWRAPRRRAWWCRRGPRCPRRASRAARGRGRCPAGRGRPWSEPCRGGRAFTNKQHRRRHSNDTFYRIWPVVQPVAKIKGVLILSLLFF